MCYYLNMFRESQAHNCQAISIIKADSAVLCSFTDLASQLGFNSSEITVLKQYLCLMTDTVSSDEFYSLFVTVGSGECINQ